MKSGKNTGSVPDTVRALQECFVGRERYLTRIEEILAEKSGPAVLYGIGGIGKTAIARAYVRRHQEEYDSVLFLSCDIGFSPLLCDDIRVAVSNLHYSKDKYGSKKQYFKEKNESSDGDWGRIQISAGAGRLQPGSRSVHGTDLCSALRYSGHDPGRSCHVGSGRRDPGDGTGTGPGMGRVCPGVPGIGADAGGMERISGIPGRGSAGIRCL